MKRYNKILVAFAISILIALSGIVTLALAMPSITSGQITQAVIGICIMAVGLVALTITSSLLLVEWEEMGL